MSSDWAKRRNARSNSARTSSGSRTATHASRSSLSFTADEEPHRRRVPRLQPRQLVALRRHRALHVGRREDGQRLLQRLGDAPVVDDQAVGLARRPCGSRGRWPGAACAPCSGESRYITCSTGASKPVSSMSQTTRIESGSSFLQEARDQLLALLLGRVVRGPARSSSLLRRRDDDRRLRRVQAVERLLVEARPPRGCTATICALKPFGWMNLV